MIDVALSLLAVIAGGVTMELFSVARPPVGYQDESGFRFGSEVPKKTEETQSGNPS